MSKQVIKLSDNAANRIKQIMTKAESSAIGVRVGVKSGGCAGMSYIMEYAKEIKPNEEVIEQKGVKVFIDPKAKKKNFRHNLFLKTRMKQNDVVAESLLKSNHCNTSQTQLDEEYVQSYKFLEILAQCKRLFDHQ